MAIQPLTLLFWKLKGNGTGALTEVTLTTGLWNSFHSHASGAEPTRWNEIDPILGLSFTFKNRMKVDVFTTSFFTPTDSYPTSTHLDLKLTYNDKWNEHFSVNPYFQHWRELNNKATVVFQPGNFRGRNLCSRRGYSDFQYRESEDRDRHGRKFCQFGFLSEA